MAVITERPLAGYTSSSTLTNAVKYQTDSGLMTAISSSKVDGDINKMVDGINEIASYNASGAYTDLTTAVDQIKLNEDGITTVNALTGGGAGQTTLANTLTNFEGRVATNEASIIAINAYNAGGAYANLSGSVDQIKVNEDAIASLIVGQLPDGDKGDITVSSSGTVWTIDNDVVTFPKMSSTAIASQAEAEAGTATDKLMTPERTEQAITELAPAPADATETVKGIVELATQAEAEAGTDDVRAMTPLKTAQAIAAGGGGLESLTLTLGATQSIPDNSETIVTTFVEEFASSAAATAWWSTSNDELTLDTGRYLILWKSTVQSFAAYYSKAIIRVDGSSSVDGSLINTINFALSTGGGNSNTHLVQTAFTADGIKTMNFSLRHNIGSAQNILASDGLNKVTIIKVS